MEYLIKSIKNVKNDKVSLFSNYKKEKIGKLTNYDSIKSSILGEILLIEGLKLFYNIDYKDVSFIINKYGKPYIENSPVFFNISHSKEYSICAFSNYEIGVDIEKIRSVDIHTMNIFACKNEIEYILKEEGNIFKRLFTIYTLKEAYLKMNGNSLKDINKVSFKIYNNKVVCSDESVEASLSYEVSNYVIAFCQKKST